MNRILAAVQVMALFVGLASEAAGQQAHDLEGSWMLSVSESDFGGTLAADSARLEIQAATDILVMREDYYFPPPQGYAFAAYDMPIDGMLRHATTQDSTLAVSVHWNDDTLVFEAEADSEVGPLEVTDRLRIVDANRNRAEIARTVYVPTMDLTIEATLVFQRLTAGN